MAVAHKKGNPPGKPGGLQNRVGTGCSAEFGKAKTCIHNTPFETVYNGFTLSNGLQACEGWHKVLVQNSTQMPLLNILDFSMPCLMTSLARREAQKSGRARRKKQPHEDHRWKIVAAMVKTEATRINPVQTMAKVFWKVLLTNSRIIVWSLVSLIR